MKKKILLLATVVLLSLGLIGISKVVQNKYINENNVSAEKKASEELNTSKEIDLKTGNKDQQNNKDAGIDTNKEDVKPVIKEVATTNTESKTGAEQKNPVDRKAEVKTGVAKTPSAEGEKNVKDVTKEPVVKVSEPQKEPNLIIKDEISGKTILSMNVSTDNKTVSEITFRELDNSGINYKSTGRGDAVYFTMINGIKERDFGPISGWCYFVNGTKSSISSGAYKLKSGDIVEWKYLKDGVNN